MDRCLRSCAPAAVPIAASQTADAGLATNGRAPKAPVPLEEYFNTRRLGPPRFSADDKWVAYSSDEGGRPDVWIQPLAGARRASSPTSRAS